MSRLSPEVWLFTFDSATSSSDGRIMLDGLDLDGLAVPTCDPNNAAAEPMKDVGRLRILRPFT